MLIQESFHDVPTKADGNGTMREAPIYLFIFELAGSDGVFSLRIRGHLANMAVTMKASMYSIPLSLDILRPDSLA
ncbi:unnamed protein product [Aspergillus oryzae]|uniref:Unnamed protein product n=2 Tax=Aspergillus oryzae TaxID=5062 RepID=A0AAN4YXV3_ASPOZ|nr:unnamed protein product [Aspergillus oryzae]GMF84709.1 unnamed protein product [Aspergillus oryzae]GMG03363.1 unnamed protein product [Aspergillus oryzae]GMG37777.1 unnamed protein product [Aspergillus oryzae]GMG43767.1 unnamed protein product [Aspergillus oryzae var. brunneus]